MSFKVEELYPCVPTTTRGESTKLSAHKDKLVYTNGRMVVVSILSDLRSIACLILLRRIDPRSEGSHHIQGVYHCTLSLWHSTEPVVGDCLFRTRTKCYCRKDISLRILLCFCRRVRNRCVRSSDITSERLKQCGSITCLQCAFGIRWVKINHWRENTRSFLEACKYLTISVSLSRELIYGSEVKI